MSLVTAQDGMTSLYEPLNNNKREIRFIQLHPAIHRDDSIVCSLLKYSHSDAPNYAALSYPWGDLSTTTEIAINGIQVAVTSNLETALKDIREATLGVNSEEPKSGPIYLDRCNLHQSNRLGGEILPGPTHA